MRLDLPDNAFAITVSALEPLPIVVTRAALEERCRAGAPAELVVERVELTTTALGWPCLVLSGRCGEDRLLRVCYRFLDHGAVVEARGPDAAALWAILTEARPDWSGELSALSQLFA